MNEANRVLLLAGCLWLCGCGRTGTDRYARAGAGEELVQPVKQSGESWMVRSTNGVPLRWVRDQRHSGRPDSWSFFKDGKAFLDEADFDHDGKVDAIYLHVLSEDKTRVREFSFGLDDPKRNVFILHEDTGWQPYGTQDKASR